MQSQKRERKGRKGFAKNAKEIDMETTFAPFAVCFRSIRVHLRTPDKVTSMKAAIGTIGSASAIPLCLMAVLWLAGCGQQGSVGEAQVRQPDTGRWYTEQQVQKGARVFAVYCAACHGGRAQADENWRQRGPDGKFPPPPLNGTAHAWHHPLFELREIIRDGSDPQLGNMPGWREVLSDEEIDATIAWFQSLWPHEVYEAWREIDERRQDERPR
jgi:mono/diheme cytochrome c family protein